MTTEHPDQPPRLVYANQNGEILDFPDLAMAGRSGRDFMAPDLEDLIPLPEGSDLFVLPDRYPVGIDPEDGEPARLVEDPEEPGREILAVAAFMAPAHTANHWAAFTRKSADIKPLPLFAYTAVGWHDGRFWVSAFRSDSDLRQEPCRYRPAAIRKNTNRQLKSHPDNRLIQHLGKCSLTYGCPAAVNYFMGKWEAPLPTSPHCNARCLGCISLQPSGCCPATQDRIRFVPRPEEIAEIAVAHLEKTGHVVSFGQGCEGEPLLQAETLEKSIVLIRKNTGKGTVNLNSNASLPGSVERLAKAGLDSMRVSMNSARPEYHQRYYRPSGFGFSDVLTSIDAMKENGRFVSLNYFILPGFTDDPEEFEALCRIIECHRPDFIQLRNLNMDPDWYLDSIQHNPSQQPLGMRNWLDLLRNRFPALGFGYFNPPLSLRVFGNS